MYTEKDIETVKEIILKNVPSVESIILFGSYARGDARENSDMDFMILTKSELEHSVMLKLLSSLQLEIARKGYLADLMIKTATKYHDESDLPTLSRVILREGKII